MEGLKCNICERNIREIKAFPIWTEEFGIICSQCCYLGVMYKEGKIDDRSIDLIPDKIKTKIKKIYK
jgi:hypothetical protein